MTDAPARRYVMVNLTPFCPGVEPGTPIGSDGRWLALYAVPPALAVRAILERLGRPAHAVQARPQALGDVAILARVPAEAPAWLKPATVQPLAFVASGLTAPEIAAELAVLCAGKGEAADLRRSA